MSGTSGAFGIVVSGGPAPGINSVICSAVIEATNNHRRIYGLNNGFRDASIGAQNALTELTIDAIVPYANRGGSILGTSRYNPFNEPESEERFISTLNSKNIDKLIVIGGEGSAFLSHKLSLKFPNIKVGHVPKTIDNDLILPLHYPSFGFETARTAGMKILETLMLDAKTTQRWFLVTCFGRRAGFLALGLGLAAGTTLTLIPEEFTEHSKTPDEISEIIFQSIKHRYQNGKHYGVALLAEGLFDALDPDSSPVLSACPRDDLGRIRYAQIELSDVLLPPLIQKCRLAGIDVPISPKNIGYELRCEAPASFDVEYTKFLGWGAVKLLLEGRSGFLVTKNYDSLGFIPLSELANPDGSIRARSVDLSSDLYKVARSFMIRWD